MEKDEPMSKFTDTQIDKINEIIQAAKWIGDDGMVMRWRDIKAGRVFDATEINGLER
jgi:hypothetical protein